jgi:hypothetical protein
MGSDDRTAFARMVREADRVTEQVDCMPIVDGDPPVQRTQDEVGGRNGVGSPSDRPRVICRDTVGPQRVGQAVAVQHPLNGGFAGQRLNSQPPQFALNRATANQPVARRWRGAGFAHVAHSYDGRFDGGGQAVGRRVRGARAVGKVGTGLGLVALPPFVKPLQRPSQGSTNVGGPLALPPASNCDAPQPLFVGEWRCQAPALVQEPYS